MKRHITISIIVSLLIGIVACSKVAVTGRRQLSLVPNSQILGMSSQQYVGFLQENPLSSDMDATATVRKVGKGIALAVEEFLRSEGYAEDVKDYAWEFNLVESDQVNAWCMPGGKVVFYTGILPICQDEAGIAVVMGHEVAHAVARHGQERMSQELLRTAGAIAIDVATQNEAPETQAAWKTAYGLGTTVGVMLPFSRSHESEADRMGLIFMAMAGYDPANAPDFWTRMSQGGGQKPPEMLSTHPSDDRRIRDLNKHMPEALEYYRPGD